MGVELETDPDSSYAAIITTRPPRDHRTANYYQLFHGRPNSWVRLAGILLRQVTWPECGNRNARTFFGAESVFKVCSALCTGTSGPTLRHRGQCASCIDSC